MRWLDGSDMHLGFSCVNVFYIGKVQRQCPNYIMEKMWDKDTGKNLWCICSISIFICNLVVRF